MRKPVGIRNTALMACAVALLIGRIQSLRFGMQCGGRAMSGPRHKVASH